MRSYDEALVAAEDRPAFSNGFESECWMGGWCDNCAVDAPFQRGQANEGCPLVLVALLDKTPAEWVDRNDASVANKFRCTEYRPIDESDGGSEPEPDPPPEMPGQLDLFTAATLDDIEAELSKPLAVSSGR